MPVGSNFLYDKSNFISGYRPNFIVWEENKGIVSGSNFSINQTLAKDRVNAYLNNAKVATEDFAPTESDFLCGKYAVLRKGKRDLATVELID